MKSIFYLFLLLTILSCKEQAANPKPEANTKVARQLSETELYRKAYDIADLKLLKDPSKFVGRFTITKRYNNTFFIEIDEIANGINLCVKQPVVFMNDYREYDTTRSLPFNQLCYWYVDASADSIKKAFLKYDSGKTIKDIECSRCLDPEIWTIEIYNKGQYSFTTKDYLRGSDSAFVNMLYDKVKMFKKNNYHIKYDR